MDHPVQWLVNNVLGLVWLVVIVNAVMSWLVAFDVINLRNKFVATVYDTSDRLTGPLLAPIRRVIPNLGGVDLSPIVLLIGVGFLQKLANAYIPF